MKTLEGSTKARENIRITLEKSEFFLKCFWGSLGVVLLDTTAILDEQSGLLDDDAVCTVRLDAIYTPVFDILISIKLGILLCLSIVQICPVIGLILEVILVQSGLLSGVP